MDVSAFLESSMTSVQRPSRVLLPWEHGGMLGAAFGTSSILSWLESPVDVKGSVPLPSSASAPAPDESEVRAVQIVKRQTLRAVTPPLSFFDFWLAFVKDMC